MATRLMVTRRDLLTVSAASIAFSVSGSVSRGSAQTRTKTAYIMTGFTPGLTDGVARLVAGHMKDYAASIVVETRPGASGRIAVEAVKAADPNGSVILFAPLGFIILFPHVYKTLTYKPQDFTPVSTVASFPTLLTVGPKVPGDARTVADFVAWCRANPKQATYGTAGVGTTLHFIGAMLGRSASFEFLHVPYPGNAAIQDLLKGEIASAIMPIGSSLGLVQSGDLRALATTGPRRSSFLPDVPTMVEAGYPSLQDLTWYGFFVPAKTPADTVERLNSTIQEALRTDEVKSGMAKMSVEIDSISMSDFAQLIGSESERWKAIVQATGFTPTD
jgi:tripartite-type tricarboxylate transporter receptor subunit TctC